MTKEEIEIEQDKEYQKHLTIMEQAHCPDCGRFAKWGGDRHYYNGWFDMYSFDTICAKCGTVTTECVW